MNALAPQDNTVPETQVAAIGLQGLFCNYLSTDASTLNNAHGFGVHGSSFTTSSGQNIYYINNYNYGPPALTDPTQDDLLRRNEQLHRRIIEMETQVARLSELREHDEASHNDMLLDIKQYLQRIELRLCPQPQPSLENEELAGRHQSQRENVFTDIMQAMQRIESYLPPQFEVSSSKQASRNNGHHTRLHHARNSHSEYRQRTGPSLREPCSSPYNSSDEAKSVHDNTRTEPRRFADLPPHRGRYHPYGGDNPRSRRSPFGSLDYDTRISFSGRKYVSDRRVRPLDDHVYRDYPVRSPR